MSIDVGDVVLEIEGIDARIFFDKELSNAFCIAGIEVGHFGGEIM
jgi:hypothetical protein